MDEQPSSDDFNAERFVDDLLTKGAAVSSDQTNAFFNKSLALPEDFDETKFKRGQKFYHEHIFAMFIAKLLGLITIFAIPSIRRVLSFTSQSSTPRSAYRRYTATLLHMNVWYSDNFATGSKLWKSLANVRKRHNNASKSTTTFISQLDMALTQFGFMGYVLVNPHEVGVHFPDEYGLHCWVYLWRVVGHLMGIQPEFNICRQSVSETRAICALLIEKKFKAYVEMQDPEFQRMSTAVIEGMTVLQPFLRPTWIRLKILKLICPQSEAYKCVEGGLTSGEQRFVRFIDGVIRTYQYPILHGYHDFVMRLSMWLIEHFPFLAIFRFGWRDAYIPWKLERASVRSPPMELCC